MSKKQVELVVRLQTKNSNRHSTPLRCDVHIVELRILSYQGCLIYNNGKLINEITGENGLLNNMVCANPALQNILPGFNNKVGLVSVILLDFQNKTLLCHYPNCYTEKIEGLLLFTSCHSIFSV